ncbi:InlB B-repeat-containing protein [Flammeovirga sp. SJP92]|uniref:InlB B-repeat-containing protein n=1 Tax=Flammeovirga sp. SJP92 TaxID=1775430 RepID=UPI0007885FE0|nr:InlB B-repeat-containing protein [Flammeovirga sp. SJP92]KXX72001.1 hypothetical protein AVL50_04250 [Flammeovirga sp. SJP92]
MKKQLTNLINLLFLILAVGFIGCEKATEELPLFEVHFDANAGSPVPSQLILQGDTVLKPADPTLEGSEFVTWTKDDIIYDFGQAVAEEFTLKATWDKVIVQHNVTFNQNNGEEAVIVAVVENEAVATPDENPTMEGYDFMGWYHNEEEYNFSSPITAPITIDAKFIRSVGETEVVYQTISFDDFQNMESQKHMIVKAQINYLMFGWAWGTEAYITDTEGNSSKDFYSHSNFGMFSFPLKFTKDDAHIEGQTFVFDVVKDVYMSSPQLGFGYGRNEEFDETGTGAYNGSKWLAPMRYGVEYFDEVVRGNVREVTFTSEDGLKVLVGETEMYIKALGDKEGTYDNVSEDYKAIIEAMLGQNKFVRTITVDGKVISVLRNENLQFTDNI